MTVRLRLTLLYGVLFLLSGAVLLGITYLLVVHGGTSVLMSTQSSTPDGNSVSTYLVGGLPDGAQLPEAERRVTEMLQRQAAEQQARFTHELLVKSGLALAIMAVVSAALGWLMAGRALRPLHTMNTRLAAALDSHRRFVANAAHELRTPLTLEHALLEETVLDPDATADDFRAQFGELMVVSGQQARLLESLLVLATSERGLDHRESVDLAALAGGALGLDGLTVVAEIGPARVSGDPVLLERLVANLIDNAASYNVPDGRVEVATGVSGGRAFLSVSNTGPPVPPDMVGRLLSPFQRLERTADDGHHGLGLSIVHAIAVAHGAELTVRARTGGGLSVKVVFVAVV